MLQNSIGNDSESQERLQKFKDSLPMKRVTEPSDVANAPWFPGSQESSFVTGTTVEVCPEIWETLLLISPTDSKIH